MEETDAVQGRAPPAARFLNTWVTPRHSARRQSHNRGTRSNPRSVGVGNTSARREPRQIPSGRATPLGVGSPAQYAALTAPTDAPTTRSASMP